LDDDEFLSQEGIVQQGVELADLRLHLGVGGFGHIAYEVLV